MSLWSTFRGHADQREMFRRAIERGRLSQGYLFVGPGGVGKQLFARRLAQCLLCVEPSDPLEACGECRSCRPFQAGNHPDFLYVDRPEGRRELQMELIVGPKKRRGQAGLCHDLSLRPLDGSRKIAIVNDADTMNEESSNAFLKTLEEPPERAVLMLIAANLDAVMPTIRSRCQLVRFGPLAINDVEALLIQEELAQSAEDARFAASLSGGSLTVARQLLQPALQELRSTLYQTLADTGFNGLALSKTVLESIDNISKDTPEQRVYAAQVLLFAVEFYRAALRSVDGSAPQPASSSPIPAAAAWATILAARTEPLELISALIERTIAATIHIDQNVPVPLCLDAVFDDLARMNRGVTVAR